jgi:hypothetical protein
MLNRTTIAITQDVRDSLKHIARKDQDYNDILKELVKLFESQNQKEKTGESDQ